MAGSLTAEEVCGKSVLEVGSRQVQTPDLTARHIVARLQPAQYVGVDIDIGPGVDEICDAEHLRERFGDESFDVVISTEMLEHVRNWRPVISNFKHVVRPRGVLLVTTRSRGFRYHGWPEDYWRYEVDDMRVLFSDFEIQALEPDLATPGVFLKALKPVAFQEADLSRHTLYSVVKRRRAELISRRDQRLFHLLHKPLALAREKTPRPIRKMWRDSPLSSEWRSLRRAEHEMSKRPD